MRRQRIRFLGGPRGDEVLEVDSPLPYRVTVYQLVALQELRVAAFAGPPIGREPEPLTGRTEDYELMNVFTDRTPIRARVYVHPDARGRVLEWSEMIETHLETLFAGIGAPTLTAAELELRVRELL